MADPKLHTPTAERWHFLLQAQRVLELPLAVLGLGWFALLVVELTHGLTDFLRQMSLLIWAIFLLDFCFRLLVAPDRLRYIRRNWLTLASLIVPAVRVIRLFRIVRLLRIARAARGMNLVRVVASVNRGMRALRLSLRRKGFIYVASLTLLVQLAGSAGIYALEREVPDPVGIHDFGTALWWTAMMLTTMGSQYWPHTPEGRVLSWLLATYAFAVFGYITAAVASFFVGRDASAPGAELPGAQQVQQVLRELQALREELRVMKERQVIHE